MSGLDHGIAGYRGGIVGSERPQAPRVRGSAHTLFVLRGARNEGCGRKKEGIETPEGRRIACPNLHVHHVVEFRGVCDGAGKWRAGRKQGSGRGAFGGEGGGRAVAAWVPADPSASCARTLDSHIQRRT